MLLTFHVAVGVDGEGGEVEGAAQERHEQAHRHLPNHRHHPQAQQVLQPQVQHLQPLLTAHGMQCVSCEVYYKIMEIWSKPANRGKVFKVDRIMKNVLKLIIIVNMQYFHYLDK